MKTYTRLQRMPNDSFFLFGPRGTGKSTWFSERQQKNHYSIDLLDSEQYLRLTRNPSSLTNPFPNLKAGDWIWIDEIQKIPALLDEVHRLIEKKKIRFAMTGSSARKLRRGGANLLAGRAQTLHMEGLSFAELKSDFKLKTILELGTLPTLYQPHKNPITYLSDYVLTYLKEEIQAEGIVRKVDPYFRFLEVAGMLNGQKLNASNVSREAGVARSSIDHYFQILQDTLMCHFLPGFQPKAKVRERSLPKLYWFDAGVARACAGLLREDMESTWLGYSLETYIFHELRIYNEVAQKFREFYYFMTPSNREIDFIIELKKGTLNKPAEIICIEIKLSSKWKNEWSNEMDSLSESSKVKVAKKIGIYTGPQKLQINKTTVYPVQDFLQDLFAGKIY